MNELHLEASPYLLQHKNNPIFWKSWNENSLNLAKSENKLIVISIGYSACHWCHVMEHESFEDEDVAQVMNQNFINIKVDREEHPDVDAVYMKAVQLMTQHGGWPLNIVALPDGRPIWGGTYFKKDTWIDSLNQLQKLFENDPKRMNDYADNLESALEGLNQLVEQPSTENHEELLKNFVNKWSKSFDHEFGGYTRAPKFMMPTNYKFLLRYAHQTQNKELLDYVYLTLNRMAWGGIFDTIDGGFSRYSVDMKWHIPHFEKMLYDNGQLLSLYSDAYKLSNNKLYKNIVYKTFKFVSNELLDDNGGFYAALDADSLNAENKSEEGAFYVWNKKELHEILQNDFELFSVIFNINSFGHWENGNYVLIQTRELSEIASEVNLTEEEVNHKKENFEKILYNIRKNRAKPGLDDKIITSWNGIMNRGFTDAYKAFNDSEFLNLAIKNMDFICTKMIDENGNLYRTYKNNQAKINGVLEDYAFTIDALIGLYQVTFKSQYLYQAKQLLDYTLDYFYNYDKGLFRYKSTNDKALVTENYEIEDNVIESSNSVMTSNLYYLSVYFGLNHYEEIARRMTKIVVSNIDYPSAFSNWLYQILNQSENQKEITITGEKSLEYAKVLNSKYNPDKTIAASINPVDLNLFKGRFKNNKTLIYVCQNKNCDLPIEELTKII